MLFGDFDQFKSFRLFINEIAYGFTLGVLFWLGNRQIGIITGKRLDWVKNPKKANFLSLIAFTLYGFFISLVVPYIFLKYLWEVPADKLAGAVTGHAFICISVDILIISFILPKNTTHPS